MATTIEVNACERCPLHELRREDTPPRLAVGTAIGQDYKAGGVVIVLDQPMPDDEVKGQALAGEAGDLMADLLADAGTHLHDVAVTYMVHCRPPRGRLKDRPDAVAACEFHLTNTLRALRPGLVVVMGALGTKAVLGQKHAVSRDHGTFRVPGPKWGWTDHSPLVVVTYSHAAALFDGGAEGPIGERIVEDIKAGLSKLKELT